MTVTMHGPKVGTEVAPGRFHAGEVVVADIGLEPRRDRAPAGDAGDPRRRSAPQRAEQNKYTAGTVLVVGGSRGPDRRAEPDRRGRLPRRRRLRRRRGSRLDAGGLRAAAAGGGQAAVPRGRRPDLAPRDRADRRVRGEGGLGRARAGPRPRPGPKEVVRRLLAELDLPAVVDADGLYELEPFERKAPTVLTPHEGELGAAARRAVGLGRRAPARGGAACRRPPSAASAC